MSCVKHVKAVARSDYAISRMNDHDLIEVVEIEESCGLSLWGWDSYHAELTRPESIMLVARRAVDSNDGQRGLGGFIAARLVAEDLHINNIGVRTEFQRTGLGGSLLTAVLSTGVSQGAATAILEVRAGNVAAQALYDRYGFATVGRRRNYYRQPAEDAIIMKVLIKDSADP